MYRIPCVVPYRDDELLLSWVTRLGKANCFDDVRRFIYAYFYPNKPKYDFSDLKMDFRDVLYYFWRALPERSMDAAELLLGMTVFPGVAPLLSKAQRQRYLCQCFNVDSGMDELYPQPHGFNHALNVCPACMAKEIKEYGDYHFHRAHQMPGVAVCHIHGDTLQALGKIPRSLDIAPPEPKRRKALNNAEWALGYARFCKAFLDERFDYSVDTVADLIDQASKGKGSLSKRVKGVIAKAGVKDRDLSATFVQNLTLSSIKGSYQLPSRLLKLLYVLYGNIDALKAAVPESRVDEDFIKYAAAQGYVLNSPYRDDVVTLIHEHCGRSFSVSPYGFKIGWRCPLCSRAISVQDQFKTLVYGAGNGEYELIGKFINMDDFVDIRHLKCKKVLRTKARSFLYESVRCDCEYALGFEGVKANIESHPGFHLVEFKAIDKPLTIEHSKCGSRFRFYYSKFMANPRCRVCERRGHINRRTDADFIDDIRDLTGNEYALVGKYEGPNKPISIRHNVCGRVHAYKPYYFLDGARCPYCSSKGTSQKDFADYVEKVSDGRYKVTGRPTKNLYEVTDTESGSALRMSRTRVLQELNRPTPSPVLPLDKRVDVNLKNKTHTLFDDLQDLYPSGGLMFTEDIYKALGVNKRILTQLLGLVKDGLLVNPGPGVYGFPRDYSVSDVIETKYLVRNGHRIGYPRGVDYAFAIGLGEESSEWHIATNKESSKTTNRCTKFMGETIHIRGSNPPVSDDNWLILSALDFLIQYRQVVDKPENVVIDHVRRFIQENNKGVIPTESDFKKYMNYKAKNIVTMMERLIRRLTDVETT